MYSVPDYSKRPEKSLDELTVEALADWKNYKLTFDKAYLDTKVEYEHMLAYLIVKLLVLNSVYPKMLGSKKIVIDDHADTPFWITERQINSIVYLAKSMDLGNTTNITRL